MRPVTILFIVSLVLNVGAAIYIPFAIIGAASSGRALSVCARGLNDTKRSIAANERERQKSANYITELELDIEQYRKVSREFEDFKRSTAEQQRKLSAIYRRNAEAVKKVQDASGDSNNVLGGTGGSGVGNSGNTDL